ncbi:MAG: VTT domain-containing protein, partial [Thermoanaerobaculia bacterium]|nr:VTT domain-containing protein [Thermoanaerobaculia bacterium]
DSDHVLWWLFLASFLETVIVPIPIELILVPYMVANRDRLIPIATAVTLGCITASMLGYGVGFFLFETAGEWVIRTAGWESAYASYQAFFESHGFFAVFAVGIVPIPFQVAMLTAGAASYPVWKFTLAATLARGIRYFGLAGIVALVGDRAEALWKRHRWAAIVLLVALLGAFWGLAQWLGSRMQDSMEEARETTKLSRSIDSLHEVIPDHGGGS